MQQLNQTPNSMVDDCSNNPSLTLLEDENPFPRDDDLQAKQSFHTKMTIHHATLVLVTMNK